MTSLGEEALVDEVAPEGSEPPTLVPSLRSGAFAGLAAGAILAANFRSPGEEIFEGRAALLGLFALGISTLAWQTRRTIEGGRASALIAGSFFFLLSAASGLVLRRGDLGALSGFPLVLGLIGVLLGTGGLQGARRWIGIAACAAGVSVGALVTDATLLARLHQAGAAFAAGAFTAALVAGASLEIRKWFPFTVAAVGALVLALL